MKHFFSNNCVDCVRSAYTPPRITAGAAFAGKNYVTYFRDIPQACGGTSTPTATASATATSTPTATSTSTATSTGTPSNTPTSTQTPSNIPTSTPTATSTPTNTLTNTSTVTTTLPACMPVKVTADFSQKIDKSIQGLNAGAPGIDIEALGEARGLAIGATPIAYSAGSSRTMNGGVSSSGGFSDVPDQELLQLHHHLYTFTFGPFMTISDFSLRVSDFGDLNPTFNTNHYASMTTYAANGVVVSKQELSFTTPAQSLPTSCDLYGNLQMSGDALGAMPGQPGNWTWHVSRSGIVEVVLDFGPGFDPNIGFGTLSFTGAIPCP